MTKAQTKKQVMQFLERMSCLFHVNNYEKEVRFESEAEGDVIAMIETEENYQRLTVHIFPRFYEFKPEEQRKILLHELCHTITMPSKIALSDYKEGKFVPPDRIDDINEEETSKIENLLDALLQGKLKYAQEAYKNYLPKKEKKTKRKKK